MLLGLLFLLPAPAYAEAVADRCPDPRLSSSVYDGNIQRLLTQSDPPITTLDQFLDCLPDAFFKQNNATYVTRSQSPEAEDVSERYPRAILSDDGGGTTIAYTGKPGGKFGNQLRIIVRSPGSPARNRFISVSFNGSTRPSVVESDRECFRCHKDNFVWGSYRNWSGTFGPQSDLEWLPEDRAGYFAYQAFRAAQQGSPRYRRSIHLASGDGGPAAIESGALHFTPRQPYVPSMGYLLTRITPLQAQSVAETMERSPLFPKLRFLLASVFLGCSFDAGQWAELQSLLAKYFSGDPSLQRFLGLEHYLRDPQADPDHREQAKVELLGLVGQMLGVPQDNWTTEFHGETGPAMDLGSGSEIRDYVFADLLPAIGRDTQALEGIASSPGWSAGRYGFLLDERYADRNPARYRSLPAQACQALGPMTSNELARSAQENVTREFPQITIIARCAGCHDGSNPEAPLIPFRQTAAFHDWLVGVVRDGKMGEELFDERLYERNDMPPGGLTPVELRRIGHERGLVDALTPPPAAPHVGFQGTHG